MARNVERGLEYLPLDLDFFHDRKICKLRRLVDADAPMVYIALLCTIYKEGYYVKWDEDFAFDISETIHKGEDYVNGVINACLEVGLLSEQMFSEYRILTSAGIQRQYNTIGEKSRRRSRVEEYSIEDYCARIGDSCTGIGDSCAGIPINAALIPQSKVKESKVKESKVKESKVKESKVNSSSFPSSPDVEELTPEQEEKERIITFFTFSRNYINPNAEYGRLVSYNNSPAVRKKWNDMSATERESVMEMWHPKKETVEDHKPRFDAATLSMWKDVCTAISEAPYDVRMAALSDTVKVDTKNGILTLTCPDTLFQWIEKPGCPDEESNVGLIKPIIFPFMQANGCTKMKYQNI